MSVFSRRDFLKVAGMAATAALTSWKLVPSDPRAGNGLPNIIVVLCDAFSALHMSLHGYPRRTTPGIDDFAERCIVYHNHYSGGNYTTTGTASMLTGMIPWNHRAINYGGLVRPQLAHINPYSLLGSDYFRFAFSQNPWPDRLMGQYSGEIDRFLPPTAYSQAGNAPPLWMFERDRALSSIAMDDFLLPTQSGSVSGLSLLAYINKSATLNEAARQKLASYRNGFPEIMDPGYLIPYLNEQVYEGVFSELSKLHAERKPYFAYFHLYSPHFPYRPRNDYRELFRNDGFRPEVKPMHPMSVGLGEDFVATQRELYDCQVAQVDREFSELVLRLEENGMLENTYLVLTADHGELFERGFVGHGFRFMYEPVLRIPLLIKKPGQTQREDIFANTSNVDLLPTLLTISGRDIPSEIDGRVLPALGGTSDAERPIFSMVATENSAFGPIKKAVVSVRKGTYKLIHYLGYEDDGLDSELYDLESDPHELRNLASTNTAVLDTLKEELLSHLASANKEIAGSHND